MIKRHFFTCCFKYLDVFLILSLFAGIFDNLSVQGNNIESGSKYNTPIPIISVSMNSDLRNYTVRLMKSIDFPVTQLSIQIGNSDLRTVESILAGINAHKLENSYIGSVKVVCLNYNPGSAKGFNFGLNHLITNDSDGPTWVLVVNNDIAFYPGVLRRIGRSVERALSHDQNFGVGFTSLCCGSEWSAVAFTRRLVRAVGLVDENFYPAYYEDDDYGIRIHHSALTAARFNNTPLLHGEIDGSKDYLSGLFTQLYLRPEKSAAVDSWRRAHELGVQRSVGYIEGKWGVRMGDFKSKKKLDCKSLEGINSLCATGYKTPFNDPRHNLSFWELSEDTRHRIFDAAT